MTDHALVPVFAGQLNGQSSLLCNARDLHASLGVGRDFATWIAARIKEYGFVDGDDFVRLETLSSPVSGSAKARTQVMADYHLSINMAKELAMVERNDKGRQIRRYFIACEQALARGTAEPLPPPPPPIRSRDDLSFFARDPATGRPVAWAVPHHLQGNWNAGVDVGEAFFAELVELAQYDEAEAYHALRMALGNDWEPRPGSASGWKQGGWGIECGFSRAIARAVLEGLRARAGGAPQFNPQSPSKKGPAGRLALPRPARKPKAQPALLLPPPVPAQPELRGMLH